MNIAEGLMEYFTKSEAWLETAFMIDDKERGAIGSGVVKHGPTGSNFQSGEDSGSTVTS